MSPQNLVWLKMETNDTPMHLGVLATFKIPAKADKDYLSDLATSLREAGEAVAPWNQRLSFSGEGILGSRFLKDDHFSLDHHFRHSALPQPGGEKELGILVSRLHSNPIVRDGPLWELHLIEGIAGRRYAFYLKVHHALIGDVNLLETFMASLSTTARQRDVRPIWTLPLPSKQGEEDEASASDGIDQFKSAIKPYTFDALKNSVFQLPALSAQFSKNAPRSTLNRKINGQRRFSTFHIELARIQTLADATQSDRKQILIYLCGTALRRFFKEYNSLPDESLIAMAPVSVSALGDTESVRVLKLLRLPLATNVGDPLSRLEVVKASLSKARQVARTLPTPLSDGYNIVQSLNMFSKQLMGVGRFVPKGFNLTISSTDGCDSALFLKGARLETIYPVNHLMQFNALSIDCVNYGGALNVGVVGAHDTLPHLQRIAVYLGTALNELEELVLGNEVVS
ncbi:wax ester/triacylglycerol synthase domain-containing protein [Zhongshania sp.]|jgi:diacylglycerol O-acyltransferase|uniref:wax ester/triacylglycerol synthase domain-containing protein n=1 Tax=Zhongshania sp. TaxID=1971902 RepID=UPI0039E54EED